MRPKRPSKLTGLLTGVAMLGSSIFSANPAYANPKSVYSERFGNVRVDGYVWERENVLGIRVLANNYDQRGRKGDIVQHPDVILIYPKDVDIKKEEISERGYLPDLGRMTDLKQSEKRNRLPQSILNTILGGFLGVEVNAVEGIKGLDNLRKNCENDESWYILDAIKANPSTINQWKTFAVPQYSSVATMTFVEYKIPIDSSRYNGEGTIMFVVARINRSGFKSHCIGFDFGIKGNKN